MPLTASTSTSTDAARLSITGLGTLHVIGVMRLGHGDLIATIGLIGFFGTEVQPAIGQTALGLGHSAAYLRGRPVPSWRLRFLHIRTREERSVKVLQSRPTGNTRVVTGLKR
jgi:hypothetical protein